MKKLYNSTKYAIAGFIQFIRTDRNGQTELVSAIIAIGLGAYLNISSTEWGLVIICIGAVLAAEMFNHAIEKTCDHISPDHHKGIGIIKDVAASAVMMTVLMSLVICYIVFFSKIVARFVH
ncbi:MAG TPA: diacylglycerol kinase family protein [Saprospiraceae bacterium]|nr:diacylglycerol kinase family protein [Saprospiraceae bacterium]